MNDLLKEAQAMQRCRSVALSLAHQVPSPPRALCMYAQQRSSPLLLSWQQHAARCPCAGL
jgi:hypothetical protein